MVNLTFKTLQQKSFTLEAAETETIADVKSKIETSQSFPVELQKLILKGKILADDIAVGSIGAGEKDFIVVMVTKPKAAPTVSTSASVPSSATTQVAPTVSSVPSSATTQVAPQTATTAVASPATATAAAPSSEPVPSAFTESTLATGSQYEVAVNNLVEMGFPRDQVVAAMRAAFNNPDRAADYLMTGIPDNIREPAPEAAAPTPAAVPTTAPTATATTPSTTSPTSGQYVNLFQQAAALNQQSGAAAAPTAAAGGPGGMADLEFLRNSPQFQNLRQMVQAQPHLLPTLLQQIGQTNPQLLQMITQNQDQFLSMLTDGAGLEGGAAAPQEQYVTITPEENEAVNRLVALGFDRNLALEAYLACDKNEELAANYLFDMGGGDF